MTEDPGAGSGGGGAEELIFLAEQLAGIDRLVTAGLVAASVPTPSVSGSNNPQPTSAPPILPSLEHGKFPSLVARQARQVGYMVYRKWTLMPSTGMLDWLLGLPTHGDTRAAHWDVPARSD